MNDVVDVMEDSVYWINSVDRVNYDSDANVLNFDMAQGLSNSALSTELYVSAKTIEAHVRSIFTKLDLTPDPSEHWRVLAVVAFLHS